MEEDIKMLQEEVKGLNLKVKVLGKFIESLLILESIELNSQKIISIEQARTALKEIKL
jgi:hypothetical protein